MHANNPKDAIKAIKTNIILGGGLSSVDDRMLDSLIVTAIDYIIQIARVKNQRVVTDILNLKELDIAKIVA